MQHTFFTWYLDSPLVRGRSLDIFTPDADPDRWEETALFIVHGGGWNGGTKVLFHPLMEAWNRCGFICASSDYRPADGGNITALEQLHDLRESYDRFVTFLKDHHRPLKIAVYGESAGAHLAALLALAEPGACGEPSPAAANEYVPSSLLMLQATPMRFDPWPGIFPHAWQIMEKYAAGTSYERNPELFRRLAPISHLSPANPTIFFLEAENEHMFPRRYNLEAVRQHRAMGIPSLMKIYADAEHGFIYDLTRECQRQAFADILRFMRGEPISGTEAIPQ